MHIRITKKLANALNGFDLRSFTIGQVIELDESLARMLIAEDWAEAALVPVDAPSTASDRSRSAKRKRSQVSGRKPP